MEGLIALLTAPIWLPIVCLIAMHNAEENIKRKHRR